MFINVPKRGRVKSGKYKAWTIAAGLLLNSQHPEPVRGPVSIAIKVKRQSKASDIDNRVKACLDLLVQHHIIDDDRNVMRVSAEWADVHSCEVAIQSLGE
jgi:Holliday junction resolvase RusA-like endonuclease